MTVFSSYSFFSLSNPEPLPHWSKGLEEPGRIKKEPGEHQKVSLDDAFSSLLICFQDT